MISNLYYWKKKDQVYIFEELLTLIFRLLREFFEFYEISSYNNPLFKVVSSFCDLMQLFLNHFWSFINEKVFQFLLSFLLNQILIQYFLQINLRSIFQVKIYDLYKYFTIICNQLKHSHPIWLTTWRIFFCNTSIFSVWKQIEEYNEKLIMLFYSNQKFFEAKVWLSKH